MSRGARAASQRDGRVRALRRETHRSFQPEAARGSGSEAPGPLHRITSDWGVVAALNTVFHPFLLQISQNKWLQ